MQQKKWMNNDTSGPFQYEYHKFNPCLTGVSEIYQLGITIFNCENTDV